MNVRLLATMGVAF